ncbi:PQQ-dependent sugar dehydrogenase [Hansschlegelia zhihuaiae]|uniref:PQQ-dependent sugar dehydrogenase n=1 Tax=Hansschlegelia zhihuaiae TaxID=405005 RepID=A0A4V1KJ16_9HYPH|nr:PQQ-dependent sugar dehydrogenase [Hansschlegelia zhihuaiae]RXF72622.1 PQQ-dependent sugar dehydrogenase [Hansschlegelia zhihuaiae]
MPFPLTGRAAAIALAAALAAGAGASFAVAQSKVGQSKKASEVVASEKQAFSVETVAEGLERPWGVAFLPDGRMLVTEKAGRMRIVLPDGKLSAPVTGLPKVDARGQGGLLDVAVAPDFAQTKLVYFTFAEAGEGGVNGTALGRGRLAGNAPRLDDVEVIWRQTPKYQSTKHFGSRIVFAGDGMMFVTTGERSDREFRVKSQALDETLGKVVRLTRDGSPAAGNPFDAKDGAKPEIWSYGHRNIQGAAVNPADGKLWTVEHGPRGGDELNRPEAGQNYGWPVITYGKEYSGADIGPSQKEGMEQPVHYWVPSIGTSGLAFYTGDAYPAWKGSAFVGGLAIPTLARLELDGTKVTHEERLLEDFGERIRDVRQGPDGMLYLLTDSEEGRLLRLKPEKARS